MTEKKQELPVAGKNRALYRHPALVLPLCITAALFGLSLLSPFRDTPGLAWSLRGVAASLFIWHLALIGLRVRNAHIPALTVALKSSHYVQTAVQLGIIAYWGWHWREVYDHGGHIAAQILFAYGFDMLLCWSRRDSWVLGFGPLPIVLSINLFLWFSDGWFGLQFALIALAFVGKEYFTWVRDGKKTHIFNPSALSLFVFSLALIVTGRTDISWGKEIATTLLYPEHIYLQIFVLSLAVQALFSVTLVTLAATSALIVLGGAYYAATGVYYFLDSSIPIAVFLGLHLLITDPSSSPKTDTGRLIFGALYGSTVFALYGLLEIAGAPTFYDKLLCVPLLNLTVQALDNFARSRFITRMASSLSRLRLNPARRNLAYMGLWSVFCFAMLSTDVVGSRHQGRDPAFWEQACKAARRNACRNLIVVHGSICETGGAASCNAMGILSSEGKIIPRSPGQAAWGFTRSCQLGLEEGCANLSRFRAWRVQVARRHGVACRAGAAAACAKLAKMYNQGDGVPRDIGQAGALLRRACLGGMKQACR